MPMFKALEACPDAVVVRPDMHKYAQVGEQVREMMRALTPLVEPISIDEAFLDLTGTQRLHGASIDHVLAGFARDVEKNIGITVSVGLSYCKFLAKIASDLDKPRGFAVIGEAEALAFLRDKPVGMIWGVGRVTRERLEADGYRLIGDLQRADETDLMRRYGMEGQRLSRLAHGVDTRDVSPERETKSVSNETTFHGDIRDVDTLARELWRMSEKVSDRLKESELAGSTITLKLKSSDFKSRTRARTLNEPTQLATRIFNAARDCLEKEADGTAFRLIGVGVSHLCDASEADHGDLADTQTTRDKAREAAVDALRKKFGGDAVVRGLTCCSGLLRRFAPRKDDTAVTCSPSQAAAHICSSCQPEQSRRNRAADCRTRHSRTDQSPEYRRAPNPACRGRNSSPPRASAARF